MSTIKIRPEELRKVANYFKNASAEATDLNNRLQGGILNLQSMWLGISKQDFYNKIPSMRKVCESYVRNLKNIEVELNRIADKFENADNHFIVKQSSALIGGTDKTNFFAKALRYDIDSQLPKNFRTFFGDIASFDKIGGESKGALIDAGFKAGDFDIHEQVVSGEAKLQFGGGIGGEAKATATIVDMGIDQEYGKLHAKIGNAEVGVEAKDGHIGFGAKADVVKGEGEIKIPIPFTDWKAVVGGEAAYGSIGGEAKLGLMNELDVGFGIGLGVKFGVEK
ncbi:WXG100 family type VII secretion target [Ectobacillus panaciterrae]|uniref:WXG100 family type VII secretion target n=1 Tax=Ectobacillus panaciterrae TaxID=363872 RepID=UPI0004109618|nr:WXG100 family type VII secretion target [Ectobacillus panaciterrae]